MNSYLMMLEKDKLKTIKAIDGLRYLINAADLDELFNPLSETQVAALRESFLLAKTHLEDLKKAIETEKKQGE